MATTDEQQALRRDPIRVVVVDDSAVYRHGIVRALHRDPRFEVAAFFDDGDVAGIAGTEHDLLLVDYLLETTTGLDVVAGLRRAGDRAPAVLISASLDDEVRVRAHSLGIRTALDKTLSRADILDELENAAARARLSVV